MYLITQYFRDWRKRAGSISTAKVRVKALSTKYKILCQLPGEKVKMQL